jgi:N-acetylglucosamine-6-sulfatase
MRRRSFLGAGALVAAVVVVLSFGTEPAEPRAGSAPVVQDPRPNFVVINTDDQRSDTLSTMSNVRRLLAGHGVTFTDSFVTTSFCCPSRASLFTGQYSRHTGVYSDGPPHGGAPAFDDRSTIATWLHTAGYTTGLVGKYLNDYALAHGPTYIPPGWDTFDTMVSEPMPRYYDYTLNENGALVHYGRTPEDYSTSVESSLATGFIDRTTGPFFLYVAPAAPHAPAIPAPGDARAFPGLPAFSNPSVDEADVSDKPWAGRFGRLGVKALGAVDSLRARMLASLRAVDRMVGAIVGALQVHGELGNTVIVYTSDNGYLWGEHRLTGKIWPYEPSIRVPLVIRTPWGGAARTDAHMALNIDTAPTLAQLAGVTPGLKVDGKSLVPLLRAAHVPWRTSFVEEYLGPQWLAKHIPPPFEAIRTERYLYVEYGNGWRELYDLAADPFELTNLAGRAGHAWLQRSLARALHRMIR